MWSTGLDRKRRLSEYSLKSGGKIAVRVKAELGFYAYIPHA